MNNKEIKQSTLGIKKLLVVLVALGVFIFLGSTFYHFKEGWDWLDSIYFSVVTLATVGYGDFTPQTDVGKIFTMFYVFVGVGFFIYAANTFLRYYTDKRIETIQLRHSKRSKNDHQE
jgi:voltage-gated potassium channel Kch